MDIITGGAERFRRERTQGAIEESRFQTDCHRGASRHHVRSKPDHIKPAVSGHRGIILGDTDELEWIRYAPVGNRRWNGCHLVADWRPATPRCLDRCRELTGNRICGSTVESHLRLDGIVRWDRRRCDLDGKERGIRMQEINRQARSRDPDLLHFLDAIIADLDRY